MNLSHSELFEEISAQEESVVSGGTGGMGVGILNQGTINTGNGNDVIIGSFGPSTSNGSVGIANGGAIDTGNGNDVIVGSANAPLGGLFG